MSTPRDGPIGVALIQATLWPFVEHAVLQHNELIDSVETFFTDDWGSRHSPDEVVDFINNIVDAHADLLESQAYNNLVDAFETFCAINGIDVNP